MPKLEQPPPADIVQVAQEVLGTCPVNGKTGRVQKRLHEIYQGRPMSIDSSRTAVRLSSWTDEADKYRLESLFHYGLCEAFNYNASVMGEQLGSHAGAIQNLEDSYKNKDGLMSRSQGIDCLTLRAILPETSTDMSLLTEEKLEIEKPGFPGVIIDLRAIAATVHLSATSPSDRWRQMAREILDMTISKEVQCVYSAAVKASMYFPLPAQFIDGIVQCCAISSNLTDEGMSSYLPAIASHVRTALGFKLNEIKKGKSKDINELVRDAVAVGWTPPGVTREEAIARYCGETSADIKYETDGDPLDNDESWPGPSNSTGFTVAITPNPTAHLKRRGPVGVMRRSDRKRKPNEFYMDNESAPVGMMQETYRAPAQTDLPNSSQEEWWKEEDQ